MTEKKDRFEESFAKLKEISEKISDEETSLEDSIRYYEEGMKYYEECNEILRKAEQKIEIMDAGTDKEEQ